MSTSARSVGDRELEFAKCSLVLAEIAGHNRFIRHNMNR